jgi:hypothetical protein
VKFQRDQYLFCFNRKDGIPALTSVIEVCDINPRLDHHNIHKVHHHDISFNLQALPPQPSINNNLSILLSIEQVGQWIGFGIAVFFRVAWIFVSRQSIPTASMDRKGTFMVNCRVYKQTTCKVSWPRRYKWSALHGIWSELHGKFSLDQYYVRKLTASRSCQVRCAPQPKGSQQRFEMNACSPSC